MLNSLLALLSSTSIPHRAQVLQAALHAMPHLLALLGALRAGVHGGAAPLADLLHLGLELLTLEEDDEDSLVHVLTLGERRCILMLFTPRLKISYMKTSSYRNGTKAGCYNSVKKP